MFDFLFFLNAVLLGVALAIDAFSVSVVNGIAEPNIKKRKAAAIASVFAAFQFLMPVLGWLLLELVVTAFSAVSTAVPYVALVILCFLGLRSMRNGVKGDGEKSFAIGFGALLLQGLATSLDALSVGLTLEGSDARAALATSAIIGVVTFIICFIGVLIGKKVGEKISRYAGIIGGVVLIGIGIEIFIRGIV